MQFKKSLIKKKTLAHKRKKKRAKIGVAKMNRKISTKFYICKLLQFYFFNATNKNCAKKISKVVATMKKYLIAIRCHNIASSR